MFPSLYILVLLGQFTESPKPPENDRAQVAQSGEQGQISWSDAEDKVTGSFSPFIAESGKPIDVVVRVGNVQGSPFDGPVTLTLKQQNQQGPGDAKTVKMMPEARAWAAQLTSGESGLYWLEIAFTTSRHKVVRVEITVADARLSRWPWYALAGSLSVLILGLGVRAVIGKKT